MESALVIKVARHLVRVGRTPEAVAILAASAVREGQGESGELFLAEALRITPGSPICKEAFEIIQGVDGDQSLLLEAMATWVPSAIEAIASEIPKPGGGARMQLGFNNNVKYKGAAYHLQTEDSGLDNPHIISHVFADGGRVIKSHKRVYAAEVLRDDIAVYVRDLMKSQHLELAWMLKEGLLDGIVAGTERGGMSVLTDLPEKDPAALARKFRAAAPEAQTPDAPVVAPHTTASKKPDYLPLYQFEVLRSHGGTALNYEPDGDETTLGAKAGIALSHDRFCSDIEARLRFSQGRLFLTEEGHGNGVFLRVQHLSEVQSGSEIVVGDQMLRVDLNPEVYDDGPAAGPTYFYSSPKWASTFRVTQIFEGGAPGTCFLARGSTVQIGSRQGDLVFAHDPLVSPLHCYVEEHAGTLMVSDTGSRTGVFVRVHGEQEVLHGDELLVGRTRLRAVFLHV